MCANLLAVQLPGFIVGDSARYNGCRRYKASVGRVQCVCFSCVLCFKVLCGCYKQLDDSYSY